MPWFTLLILFTIAVGYTYYTSILSIVWASSLLFLIFLGLSYYQTKTKIDKKIQGIITPLMPIMMLSMLFFVQTFEAPLNLALQGKLDTASFINNVVQYIRYFVGEGQQTAAQALLKGTITINPIYTLIDELKPVLWALVILSLLLIAFIERPNSKERYPKAIWIFALTALFISLSEISYLFILQKSPFRFLMFFGPIAMFYLFTKFYSRFKTKKLGKIMIIIPIVITLFLCTVAISNLTSDWQYGSVSEKPFGYDTVQPIGNYLVQYSTNTSPLQIMGDAYYMANLYYVASSNNKLDVFSCSPLDNYAILLHDNLANEDIQPFIQAMHSMKTNGLILFNDNRPLWGSCLGYATTIPTTEPFNNNSEFNLVYNNGLSIYYTLQT